jgi:hypothetical protein
MNVTLVTQHALAMRHIVICGLYGYTVFFQIILKLHNFREMLLNVNMCFDFSLQILSEINLLLFHGNNVYAKPPQYSEYT